MQRIEGGQGDPGRTRKTIGHFCFSLGRHRSCPVATIHRRSLSTHRFCSSTHHDVLDYGAAAAFQKLRLGAVCGADCGAAASFKSFIFRFLLLSSFNFVLCDVGHFFVTQSHSIDVSRWSALSISSHSRIIFMSFFCGHCIFVFE